ncbi:acetate kinase [Micromonospora zingiberis]|uniref:Acetate kinase n=1 Tax=Micromonospora zingiberis TaxID=2053011 RepID=A0A4R0GQ17_9ACTN|nr:acetate kinase [Micromonospora zingiberis]TCB97691.1 acetate kinase [Micromonospora zingiberis]
MTKALVLNCGSSSVKYRLYDADQVLAKGTVERVGEPGGGPPDHAAAVRQILGGLDLNGLTVVGHRVVHGGRRFTAPTLVDDAVLAAITDLVPLAPLHNPANLAGIAMAREALPEVPQVAVFDTAFHHTLPDSAATYAIDHDIAQRYGIRRYGFHGTSHSYVSRRTAELLERPYDQVNTVSLHLGNGASACAVAGGRSVATSMGMSPLEGLVMGTRSGDLDPTIVFHLRREGGMGVDEIDDLLNHRSGLLGLTGANDMREVLTRRAAGDAAAALAFDVYCRRITGYVGAYYALLGRVDAVTFTAGVGEHAAPVRAAALAGLDRLGITVDADRNAGSGDRFISPAGAEVAVCVIGTDEEREIARAARAVVAAG